MKYSSKQFETFLKEQSEEMKKNARHMIANQIINSLDTAEQSLKALVQQINQGKNCFLLPGTSNKSLRLHGAVQYIRSCEENGKDMIDLYEAYVQEKWNEAQWRSILAPQEENRNEPDDLPH